jgi:5'-nucleotidase
MKILITNDDSHRSPLLELAIEYFSAWGEVHLVVPAHEQSWTGKRMTRFEPVHVTEAEIFGRKAFSVAGSPADCANLGIYSLLGGKPDLVVSGINAGFNIGLGFLLSSGTIGACIEANLAGVPAIALSQAFDTATRNRYVDDYLIEQSTMDRFRVQTREVLDRFVPVVFSDDLKREVLETPVTWNINLPFENRRAETLVVAPLGEARYGGCFVERAMLPGTTVRVFQHELLREVRDNREDTDSALLRSGVATLSAINLWHLAKNDQFEARINRVLQALQ